MGSTLSVLTDMRRKLTGPASHRFSLMQPSTVGSQAMLSLSDVDVLGLVSRSSFTRPFSISVSRHSESDRSGSFMTGACLLRPLNNAHKITMSIPPPIGVVIHNGENASRGRLCFPSQTKNGSVDQTVHQLATTLGSQINRKNRNAKTPAITGCLLSHLLIRIFANTARPGCLWCQ